MKRPIAVMVDAEELKIMHEGGMYALADKRTEAIVRQHIAGNSRFNCIPIDCYLQGIRDAADAFNEERSNGKSKK